MRQNNRLSDYELMDCIEQGLGKFGSSMKYAVTWRMVALGDPPKEGILTNPQAFVSNLITLAQGTGILMFEAGTSGVRISGNSLASNDIGIGLYFDTSRSIHMHGNNVLSGREYGLVIYDESESFTGNTISNTPVGVGVVSDTSGLTAVASGSDTFSSSVQIDCQGYSANGGSLPATLVREIIREKVVFSE
jgi:hypothetical protein